MAVKMIKAPIHGLELLRGLCALSVAVFHCGGWSSGVHFHTWGLYGVYIFFVISGAVMYYNYHGMLVPGGISVPWFLYKRFARLAPLFLACVAMTAVLMHQWPLDQQLLNVSLLFGFADPGATSLVTGGWSLGIEFVMYALFPVLLAFTRSARTMIATFTALFVLRMIATGIALDGRTLVQAWSAYTQPGVFLVFFFGGMVLARINGFRAQPALALFAIPVFLFVGVSEESVLTGWKGAAYTLASIALVAGFFWSARQPIVLAISRFLGDVSYGLYLLHPIVWLVVRKFTPQLDAGLQAAIAIAISLAAAWCSLYLFERPVKNWLLGFRARSLATSS
jgi:peptidoglycan/LPS O-acetylase OafA/YrhL